MLTKRAFFVDWVASNQSEHWHGDEVVAMEELSNFFKAPDFDWDYCNHRNWIEKKIASGNLTDSTMRYLVEKSNDTRVGYRYVVST